MKEFWQVLVKYVKPYKGYLGGSIVLNILSAILNIFSFSLIIPILQILFKMNDTVYSFIPWDTAGMGMKDIVINNAGVQNEDDIDINLKGTIAITEAYGIHDTIRAVLMIGSASGHTGAEFPEYTASKGGVLAYTKNVALRIAPYGGTCNSLDFGGVLTELNLPVTEDQKLWDQIMDLTPLKRWMTVEETADWAYFMTVTNRFCTGQNILIDGLEAGNAHFVWPDE